MLKLSADWPLRNVKLQVHRNHSFELAASMMGPYAAFGGWRGEFAYSDYSDSLEFSTAGGPADAELVWIDRTRYQGLDDTSFTHWLGQRIAHLRSLASGPILVMVCGGDSELEQKIAENTAPLPACLVAKLSTVADKLGEAFYDRRAMALSGTALSAGALVLVAREIACRWLPGALFPPIKAVALDLDHTLYDGVLGEDGADGVQMTRGRHELQTYLKNLKKGGVFLALVSRNELEDVQHLFEVRRDFPLQWSDFSAIAVSWGSKGAGIASAAEKLRISPDAMLFVDDNPGELMSVSMHFPALPLLHASSDATATIRTLEYYPGLWRWRGSRDDALRIDDLKASEIRETLLTQAGNEDEYFANLEVSLELAIDPVDRLARVTELSQKTNQFNLALRRISETNMMGFMSSDESAVVSVSLKDRLSDSGLVCIAVVRRSEGELLLHELCISCRALGRRLENIMIGRALALAGRKLGKGEVRCEWRAGPRNGPALNWLRTESGDSLDGREGVAPIRIWESADSLPRGISVSVRGQHD